MIGTLLMIAGGFLLALASGVNFIYSISGSCLDIYPGPVCSTGYDNVPESLHPLVKAGLYVAATVVAVAGAAVSFTARKSQVHQ